MKKPSFFSIILFFIFTIQIGAQESVSPIKQQDCFSVNSGKYISDGVVTGRVFKVAKPRIIDSVQKFAQNALVNVKIEIDENGSVIYAEADSKTPILRSLTEKAARQTRFSPTMVDGWSIKIKGQIFYKFNRGKVAISYKLEPVKYDYARFRLARAFDSQIISLIEDFQKNKNLDAYSFVKNGQAKIQLCMGEITPEIIEKIKQTQFELLEKTKSDGIIGQIVVEKLEKLADIEEIRFIVPEP